VYGARRRGRSSKHAGSGRESIGHHRTLLTCEKGRWHHARDGARGAAEHARAQGAGRGSIPGAGMSVVLQQASRRFGMVRKTSPAACRHPLRMAGRARWRTRGSRACTHTGGREGKRPWCGDDRGAPADLSEIGMVHRTSPAACRHPLRAPLRRWRSFGAPRQRGPGTPIFSAVRSGAFGHWLRGSAPWRRAVPKSSGLSTLAPRTRCRPPSTDVPHRDACSEPKIAGI
jgi:hypothetical protein